MVVADQETPVVVPRLWPGATIVCLATGPSLCAEDVDAVRGRARVIAIKDAYDLAPWADVVYCAGGDRTRWWNRNGDRVVAQHKGLRFALDRQCARWATVLQFGPELGLSLDPSRLALGRHSGYQAINLAAHLGASRIVLVGYDMQPTGGQHHFFGNHPTGTHPSYQEWLPHFATLVAPLAQLGVEVINATRSTAIEVFRRMTLAEALS